MQEGWEIVPNVFVFSPQAQLFLSENVSPIMVYFEEKMWPRRTHASHRSSVLRTHATCIRNGKVECQNQGVICLLGSQQLTRKPSPRSKRKIGKSHLGASAWGDHAGKIAWSVIVDWRTNPWNSHQKIPTPCMDDHQLTRDDCETVGEVLNLF